MNLNSRQWCDIVFEGRNRSYGAFELRQTSGKRHLVSFLIVVVTLALVVGIPILVDSIRYRQFPLDEKSPAIVEEYELLESIYLENILPDLKPAGPVQPNVYIIKDEPVETEVRIKPEVPLIVESDIPEEDPYLKELLEEQKLEKAQKEEFLPADDRLYTWLEEMPSFPGGEKGLTEFLARNLRYPYTASEKKVEKTVVCSFFIEKDGTVKNAMVVQPGNSLFDREALRVIRTLPKWKPAKKHGKPVRVKYILPVNFRLK